MRGRVNALSASRAPKQRNSINKSIQVIIVVRNILPVNSDHIMCSNCVLVVNSDRAAVTFQAEDSVLTDLSITLRRTVRRIVVEERVKARAIYGDAVGVDDSQAPAVSCRNRIVSNLDGLVGELRVVQAGNVRERQRSGRIWLIVCRLCLNLPHPRLVQ